jgi:hypothetical protein
VPSRRSSTRWKARAVDLAVVSCRLRRWGRRRRSHAHHDEPDLGMVDPPSKRLDPVKKNRIRPWRQQIRSRDNRFGGERAPGIRRPPLEVRRADLAPLLEAKQTLHDQDGGSDQPREPPPGSRTAARQSCEPGPAAAANGTRRHAEAPGGRSGWSFGCYDDASKKECEAPEHHRRRHRHYTGQGFRPAPIRSHQHQQG